jgi:ABC-type lipoprotein export system ATPase subunit
MRKTGKKRQNKRKSLTEEYQVVKNELVERSPVRVFEKSIRGGLKAGEIGIIAAPSGIGKTSVLVQIALDKLLQGKKVIHVSFTKHTDYVLAWYEDIFGEFVMKKNLESIAEVKNDVIKNRVLMKFSQEGISGEQINRSLRALITEGGFSAEAVIVDGLEFSPGERERLRGAKDFARELGLSIWYSCTAKTPGEASKSAGILGPAYDKRGIPLVIGDCEDLIDVIVILDPKADHIELTVSKDRDACNPEHIALRLDPKTLLILEV